MDGREFALLRRSLNLTQAELARDLEVSPTTIARWERGERRLPAAAGTSLRRLQGDRTARTHSADHVNATVLDAWSRHTEAATKLPDLVRRLIRATIGDLARVDVRAHEGVRLGGWDGWVESTAGGLKVPPGASGWEVSTDSRPREKAENAYRARRESPGCDPASTTFVFLSSRRWPRKRHWEEARNAEGFWREVRAYDADDLEEWLQHTPAVRTWTARLVGVIPPRGVMTVEDFFDEWLAGTALSADALLSGREEEARWLLSILHRVPEIISVVSDSPEEVRAFVAAALETARDDPNDSLRARALYVTDDDAWRSLVGSKRSLILVPGPGVQGSLVHAAPALGHHAIIAARHAAAEPYIVLPRLNIHRLAEALENCGLNGERARRAATNCGRQATALRRELSHAPSLLSPSWVRSVRNVDVLAGLLLAGSWDEERAADKRTLQRLVDRPYSEIVNVIREAQSGLDVPFRQIGTVWRWTSHADAWSFLAPQLLRDQLKRFHDLCVEILGGDEEDLDASSNDVEGGSPARGEKGWSGALRIGMAESVALLGVRSAPLRSGSLDPEDRARMIVRAVLSSGTWKRWARLGRALPHLAEAAPTEFFRALDAFDRESIEQFLGDTAGGEWLHCDLLWALEALAWSPDHLTRAVGALGRLARLDPGGRCGNRPAQSLRDIFIGWAPHTTAPLERRLEAIDRLIRDEPNVAWRLLLDLLPRHGREFSTPTHKPEWHDWLMAWTPNVTRQEYATFAFGIYDRTLENISLDADRFGDLIELLASFQGPHLEHALGLLERTAGELLDGDARHSAWTKLRSVLHTHRFVPKADWAFPPDILDRLQGVYDQLEPTDVVARFAWLFTDWPRLPEGESGDTATAHEASRVRAVHEIVRVGGVEALLRVAAESENPFLLGFTLAALGYDELETHLLESTLGISETGGRLLGIGFVRGRAESRGREWIDRYLGDGRSSSLEPGQLADLACGLPFTTSTLASVATLAAATRRLFWQRTQSLCLHDPSPAALEDALHNFLQVARPWVAVAVLACAARDHDGELPCPADTMAHVLSEAAGSSGEGERGRIQPEGMRYEVQHLLTSLASSGFDRSRLALLEWKLLPLLDRGEYRPTIYEALGDDPLLVQSLLELVYYPEDRDERQDLSQEERYRAARGSELLRAWNTIPGARSDGSVDGAHLQRWVDEVRRLAAEVGRGKAADRCIGRLLAHCPSDPDGSWPIQCVRQVIERVANRTLQDACVVGRLNLSGVTWRAANEGGQQERKLSEQYHTWASELSGTSPKTAEILSELAHHYAARALREDQSAEARQEL